MPSKTPKQARFMAAVAHGWHPSNVPTPPMKIAQEFNQADAGGQMLKRGMGAARAKALRKA